MEVEIEMYTCIFFILTFSSYSCFDYVVVIAIICYAVLLSFLSSHNFLSPSPGKHEPNRK